MPPASDTALAAASDETIARTIAGEPPTLDSPAVAELYRRFAPRVRLYGLKHLRSEAAADDLAQDVLLVTIDRLRAGEVRQYDQIGSFVLGTSRLKAMAVRRVEHRRADLRQRYFDEEEAVAPTDADVFAGARVRPCLAAMAERDRVILVLSFYAEKSAADIGRSLDLTAGAVRVARHRALASLRGCIESRGAA